MQTEAVSHKQTKRTLGWKLIFWDTNKKSTCNEEWSSERKCVDVQASFWTATWADSVVVDKSVCSLKKP